jgi:dsRNA-specific ribonuclease
VTLGEGTSRRNAEQQAAQLAMEKIKQWHKPLDAVPWPS